MKVLLLNCSPHEKGTTHEALTILKKKFLEKSIATDIFHIGANVNSCTGCYQCISTRRCVINDSVNDLLDIIEDYDGIIVGTPVYFSSPAGGAISFLDRLFESGYEKIAYKAAASFTVARRAGTASSVDVLNKYFHFSNMPIVTNSYINSIFGRVAKDIYNDEEGLFLLSELVDNMEWILKAIESSNLNGIFHPTIKGKYYLSK